MPRHCAQLPCPESIQLLSTVHQLGVAARIVASLTAFLMTLCTLSLANRSLLDLGHILHDQLTEPQAASKETLKSRRPFVSVARKLLHSLFESGIRAAQWTNLTWDTEHSKSMSALGVYIPLVSTRLIGMSLT